MRQNIRSFLKSQMSFFRDFSQNSDFLDYIGGELIERKEMEGNDLALVDLKNRIFSGGTLLGTWGYFSSPCRYLVNILRKANGEWFVVWQDGPFNVSSTKKQTFNFRIPVSVEKGDVVAYAFQGPVGVSYDNGTGETLYTEEKLKLESSLASSELRGESDKRSYSIGVVGIFE